VYNLWLPVTWVVAFEGVAVVVDLVLLFGTVFHSVLGPVDIGHGFCV